MKRLDRTATYWSIYKLQLRMNFPWEQPYFPTMKIPRPFICINRANISARHSFFRRHEVRKDERERAEENFRESVHSVFGHALSTQNVSVQRQSRNRQSHFRMLRKLIERKRAVDFETNFWSLQTQGKTAIGCKKENQFEKEEGKNTEGMFFGFFADTRRCSSRQSAARWQQELMEHAIIITFASPAVMAALTPFIAWWKRKVNDLPKNKWPIGWPNKKRIVCTNPSGVASHVRKYFLAASITCGKPIW